MTQYLYDGRKALSFNQITEDFWVPTGSSSGNTVRRDFAELRRLYEQVGLLYRCVEIRADSLSDIPWAIVNKAGKTVWVKDDAPPADLTWLEPLPELLRMTEAALCLGSQAYWYRLHNRVKNLELRWFAPPSMMPIWDEKLGLVRFDRRITGVAEPLAVEDVVYIWRKDPMHETQPNISPAEAAMTAAGVLYSVDAFVTSFFERGALKAMIISMKGNPPKEEKERVKAWWSRTMSGLKNAFKAEVVSADGVEATVVGEGIQELSNTDLTGEKRHDIATTMGIPHSMVFSDAANHATAQTDKRTFYDSTILPDCRLIARQVNKQLLAPYGYHLEWRKDEMDVYQEDEGERSQSFATYVGAGIKHSIAAAMLGLDMPEGVKYEDLDGASELAAPQDEGGANGASTDVAQKNQILGYHIETGVVSKNEARAPLGLAPVDEVQDMAMRELRAKLEIMTIAKNAGIGPVEAAALVGLKVDIEPTPTVVVQPNGNQPPNAPIVDDAKLAESKRFRAWAKKRTNPDAAKFKSELLTDTDKAAILVEMEGGADQPFFTLTLPNGPITPDAFKSLLLQLDPDDDEKELRIREALERRTTRNLHEAFAEMLDTLYPQGYGEFADPNIEAGRVRTLFEQEQKLYDVLSRALQDGVDLGVSAAVQGLESTGFGFDYTLANEAARQFAIEHTGKLITRITDTTERGVRNNVARWIENGEPLEALSHDLQVYFGRARAESVAITEVTAAYAQGNLITWQESGVVAEVEWRTSADEIAGKCKICKPRHKQRAPLSKPEIDGIGIPGHVRCRCWWAAVLS